MGEFCSSVSVGTARRPARYTTMPRRANRIAEEVEALWLEVFHQAPPIEADASLMLDILIKHLPVPEYDRLHSAARARNLVWPVRSGGRPSGNPRS
jgi:predicted metal-dependent HD superfamily phosphohydrolase